MRLNQQHLLHLHRHFPLEKLVHHQGFLEVDLQVVYFLNQLIQQDLFLLHLQNHH